MKQLLILSGKGGTGKTTTAAAFIAFSNAQAFADCDVDAPNLHLVTQMEVEPQKSSYFGSQKASIDAKKCVGCEICVTHCRFHAIQKNGIACEVNALSCEGCGVCTAVCPHQAVRMEDDIAGDLMLYQGTTTFSTAKLKMGRGNSGKLVTEVKQAMASSVQGAELAIIDGSPGIGCPVIASISGVDMVLVVAEPSLSGISDMKRILKTCSIFATKAVVCVNKYDTCVENTAEIESFCKEKDIPFLGKVPYDSHVSKAINEGKSIATVESPAQAALKDVYNKVIRLLEL